MWNYKIRKERNDKIAFTESLINTQENERKRIAQDLFDEVSQSLFHIREQIEKTQSVTLENQAMIKITLEEVRNLSYDLH